MDFGEYSYFPYMPNSNRAIVNQLYAISSYFATNINVHNMKRSYKMITQAEIDKDTEEAMKKYYKKKIRELLRSEERLSTIRVVYYILTKKQS